MISRPSWCEMGFGARNVARFGFVAALPPRIMEVENGSLEVEFPLNYLGKFSTSMIMEKG